jgi:hypothetical protein
VQKCFHGSLLSNGVKILAGGAAGLPASRNLRPASKIEHFQTPAARSWGKLTWLNPSHDANFDAINRPATNRRYRTPAFDACVRTQALANSIIPELTIPKLTVPKSNP